MSRILKVLLILCLAANFAAAKSHSKGTDVEQAIKSELLHKSFTTKILVGSYIPCPESPRFRALRMVDTELSPDGSIKYYARANCFAPGGGFSFGPALGYVENLSGKIAPGTLVWVRGVDFKDNRVELRLSTNDSDAADGSGKIKYMVGKDYRTWSQDELMQAIAQGIVISAYEKLIHLNSEFNALRVKCDEANRNYNASGQDAASKLAAAFRLQGVLDELDRNRSELALLGRSDPQAEIYSEKLKALAPEITQLSEQIHKEQVAELRSRLQKQLSLISELQKQVRKPPSSLPEWQLNANALASYSILLDARQNLLNQLQKQNEAPAPEDLSLIKEGKAEIETLQNTLEQTHRQLELAALNVQFSQLTRKRAQLLDAYSREFGTSRERAALQELVAVLDQMVSNRQHAETLGDRAAAAQLSRFEAEEAKFKRKK